MRADEGDGGIVKTKQKPTEFRVAERVLETKFVFVSVRIERFRIPSVCCCLFSKRSWHSLPARVKLAYHARPMFVPQLTEAWAPLI
jgi:hypothetical protein